MKNIKEIWREVPNYEGYYEVSNMGRLRSLDRTVITSRGSRTYKGQVLTGYINKTTGYRQFRLTVNSEGKTLRASQLVAITYLNHTPDGHTFVVDHVNGNRLDDRVENLRIVTHRANTSTCFRKDVDSLSSKYAGVSWSKQAKKWHARISFEDKYIHLGYYDDELEASKYYQKALAKIETKNRLSI